MRIIGGSVGGRLLTVPKGWAVRPTPDLVRQALFNSLGTIPDGAAVLDLFSGTGALGLECLSRGAREVVSVELSAKHARCIRDNAARLGLPAERHELRVQDALTGLRQLVQAGRRFDLILADPPFGTPTRGKPSESWSQRLVDAEETAQVLAPGGIVALGHARRDEIRIPPGWEEARELAHGDSVFRILRRRTTP
ncbi:MAG: RsmD family RNA methyltransferase [Verrucomicrobiae bacterium]|nr:RsmD family RNA methyltransferase [Verrucomicrobiae bacterium]